MKSKIWIFVSIDLIIIIFGNEFEWHIIQIIITMMNQIKKAFLKNLSGPTTYVLIMKKAFMNRKF